jgi:hypothetical protein
MTDQEDTELLDSLRQAFELADPPPEHVLASARDVFVWQSLDAELAELVYDSKAEQSTLVRGSDTTREVLFRSPGIEVEVMVVSEFHRSLVGQVVPAQEMDIELLHSEGSATTRTDSLGRFTFDRVAPGPVKLIVVTASGMRVQTEGLVI